MRCVAVILLGLIAGNGLAQTTGQAAVNVTLPIVALLDVEPANAAITLSLPPITEAGNSLSSVSNSTQWLNYTSAVSIGGMGRSIGAYISSGSLPAGLRLMLSVGPPAGSGGGARGGSIANLTLGSTPQIILRDIGGAFTGNGINNGHPLTYTLLVQNFGQLKATQSATVTITYTFLDN